MEIIIGRESGATQPRLCLKVGNNTKFIGGAGSVPKSVSRNHCLLSIDEKNNVKISNVSDQNSIYINGMEYTAKAVSEADIIELGPERYRLDLSAVLAALKPSQTNSSPKSYDIRPLKKVWDDYNQAILDFQISERKMAVMSSIPGVLTAGSFALSFIQGLRTVFLVISGIMGVAFLVLRFKNVSKAPLLRKELDEKFQDTYVCPHCSYYLGNQRYELILRNGGCPRCKSKFTE